MKKLLFIIQFTLLGTLNFVLAQSWTLQTSSVSHNLSGVYFLNSSVGRAVSSDMAGNYILQTQNGGANWTQGISSTNLAYARGVYFINQDTGVIAKVPITRTTNNGVTWTAVSLSGINTINAITFVNSTVGYAVGSNGFNGLVGRTNDSGATWNLIGGSLGGPNLLSIFFPSTNIGYVCGQSGALYKTSNGGANWSLLTTGTTVQLNSIFFLNDTVGYCVGGDFSLNQGIILKTVNGSSWANISPPSCVNLNSVFFVSPSKGFAVGNGGKIYSTSNGGNSWNTETSGTSQHLNSVYFPNASTGWAVGSQGVILKYECPTPAAPSVSNSSPTTFCTGDSVILTSSVSSGNQWYRDGSTLPGETSQNLVVHQSGSYSVGISNSCGSTSSSAVNVIVNNLPLQPTISQSGNVLQSTPANSYQWYMDGNIINNATSQTCKSRSILTTKGRLGQQAKADSN